MELSPHHPTTLDEPGDPAARVLLTREAGRTTMSWSGEIDATSAPMMTDARERAVAADLPVVVDVSRVTFIDSSGLTGFIRLALAMPGRITVRGAEGVVRETMELVHLSELMPFLEPSTPARPGSAPSPV